MHIVIAWCGFIGSWLLVAGPLFQASIELRSEDIETERIEAVRKGIPKPTPVSVWWWILPPIKIALEKHRNDSYRKAYLGALSAEDANALVSFMSKATAWLYVAGGGLLLAINETYTLVTVEKFSFILFWGAIVIMPALSIGIVIGQVSRGKKNLSAK